jgi:tetratricopeptide (TPR) repeat protein
MRIRGIAILTGLFVIMPLSAQKKSEIREIWFEAESHYLYGEYELANPLYLMLNELKPGNANIKYKIGNCYLNIFDEKPKAIPFLEEAVRNTSYNSRTGLLKENSAPLDAYFSLGNAYRITNRLDSALNTYRFFKQLISETGKMENQDFINQQIQACNLASVQVENPVRVHIQPLKEYINQGSVNDYPVISYDGRTMAYTEKRGLENVVYVTKMEGDSWGTPKDITLETSMGSDCHTTSLNSDGTALYLFKNDNYDGNIYVTRYINGTWSPIVKLNKNINTKYYESHAAVSSDESKLYFTSNREGGMGELDIWVSGKDETGDWGIPVNLGNAINTPYNEETPFISKDGSTLTFSSEGHGSIGGYDIFLSVSSDSLWGNTVNIGYPVSTTDDDIGFQPFYEGAFGLHSIMTGYKKKEIALYNFNPPDEEARDTVTISFDPADLPYISEVDTSTLITDLTLKDVLDTDEEIDPDVLYYTVQVMALYNPVDPAYFEYADISVFYNRIDKFYRYTTGRFTTKRAAYDELTRLLRLGYPNDIFVKKVYRNDSGR